MYGRSTRRAAKAGTVGRPRRYETHKDILDNDGNPILGEDHNYITIRGYYNGPGEWVSKQEGAAHAGRSGQGGPQKIIDESQSRKLLENVIARLRPGTTGHY